MPNEYDSGYTSALTQLQNRLRQDDNLKGVVLNRVLEHIQDLLHRCKGCGGWLFNDGSCLVCEQLKVEVPVKKAVKKK